MDRRSGDDAPFPATEGGPAKHASAADTRLHVGTSGWNYKHWSGGRFYPPRLPARSWLAFYARHFHTVEVNNSFYNIPSSESLARWSQTVGRDFTFALKLWKGITHYRKLHDCREFLERFMAFCGGLPVAQRAPLLLQLPPNFTVNVERLGTFFDELRSVLHGARWQVAVEFRHASWLIPEVYALLTERGAGVALSDHGRCQVLETNDAPFVYVRRHGENYSGSYTPEQIATDAGLIRNWITGGRAVFIYYNNDIGGHALDNARQLMKELGVAGPATPTADQRGLLFDA